MRSVDVSTVGRELARRRRDAGLSRADVAKAVGCHPNTIYAIDHGRSTRPAYPTIAAYAQLVGYDLGEVTLTA